MNRRTVAVCVVALWKDCCSEIRKEDSAAVLFLAPCRSVAKFKGTAIFVYVCM